ncbi:unnamed protein product, partial [Nesidiocoris tenuis]
MAKKRMPCQLRKTKRPKTTRQTHISSYIRNEVTRTRIVTTSTTVAIATSKLSKRTTIGTTAITTALTIIQ